jgi:biopolymer transport protein TolR
MNDINMVPFIDVMLVLLIIFMATAPMMTPSVIQLPSVGQASRTPDKIIQILIDEKNTLKIYDGEHTQTSSLPKLASHIKNMQQNDRQIPVVIAADKNVKYEWVVKAMDTLQRAGITKVGLSVQTTP